MGLDSYLEPPEPEEVPTESCDDCLGTGQVDEDNEKVTCSACDGNGDVDMTRCRTCDAYQCHCDSGYDAWMESQL